MINKRLLIRNLLSHNDENSFYDKKRKIDLDSREGKAKFLKHICALSNSNPLNNSFVVIGVEDESSKIVGADFFDDSKIQNLINSCLLNPPIIQYENISFPTLPRHKVVGLITVRPSNKIASLKRNYWKYLKGMVFFRKGSISAATNTGFVLKDTNSEVVNNLEKASRGNLEMTLNGVFDFMNQHPKKFNPSYKVFKEYFVLCWSGEKKRIRGEDYYSRVDIELVKEQVRLFYSNLDDVQIEITDDKFMVTEYVFLGLNSEFKYFPLEKTIITFSDNAKYTLETQFLFQPPNYDYLKLKEIYIRNNSLVEKIETNQALSEEELKIIPDLPESYLMCSLYGFDFVKENLIKTKDFFKKLGDDKLYLKFKDVLRVMRKIKYEI
jgi:hypothetical protein